jgi:hypothetical protein
MNKQLMFKICLVLSLSMAASSAFASASITSSITMGGGTYSPSKSVNVGVNSNATNYSAQSGHFNGDRTIGTNNTDPKIYWTTKATGTSAPAPGATNVNYTSWTSL